MKISNYIQTYSTSFCGAHSASLSTLNCLQGHVESQQLQKYEIQSLLRQMANILDKYQFVVDGSFTGIPVQFSRSVMSYYLQCHELQHARPPCPSPTPGVHSNSCPSSWWCHPAISSSVVPFSSCPQSLPASESFAMSQLVSCGGQSIGVSALVSVFPMNTQEWFPL